MKLVVYANVLRHEVTQKRWKPLILLEINLPEVVWNVNYGKVFWVKIGTIVRTL